MHAFTFCVHRFLWFLLNFKWILRGTQLFSDLYYFDKRIEPLSRDKSDFHWPFLVHNETKVTQNVETFLACHECNVVIAACCERCCAIRRREAHFHSCMREWKVHTHERRWSHVTRSPMPVMPHTSQSRARGNICSKNWVRIESNSRNLLTKLFVLRDSAVKQVALSLFRPPNLPINVLNLTRKMHRSIIIMFY